MKWRQYQVGQGQTTMVIWLDTELKLKVGTRLTLKKADGVWQVEQVYDTVVENPPDTSWRVGGIVGRRE